MKRLFAVTALAAALGAAPNAFAFTANEDSNAEDAHDCAQATVKVYTNLYVKLLNEAAALCLKESDNELPEFSVKRAVSLTVPLLNTGATVQDRFGTENCALDVGSLSPNAVGQAAYMFASSLCID